MIGSDVRADVAVLKLDHPPTGIAPVPVGDSDKVEVGDQIFVIGAPYGIEQTLSAGHVSGRHQLDKKTESSGGVEFLQTDAAVNTGNSGSPIINRAAEIVGLNFDSNIQKLPNRYWYVDEADGGRAIAIHSAAIIEALRKMYVAERLAAEITGR